MATPPRAGSPPLALSLPLALPLALPLSLPLALSPPRGGSPPFGLSRPNRRSGHVRSRSGHVRSRSGHVRSSAASTASQRQSPPRPLLAPLSALRRRRRAARVAPSPRSGCRRRAAPTAGAALGGGAQALGGGARPRGRVAAAPHSGLCLRPSSASSQPCRRASSWAPPQEPPIHSYSETRA